MTNSSVPAQAAQVALVTGASRGIGAAIALELAARGYRVVGTATTDDGAARILTEQLALGATELEDRRHLENVLAGKLFAGAHTEQGTKRPGDMKPLVWSFHRARASRPDSLPFIKCTCGW